MKNYFLGKSLPFHFETQIPDRFAEKFVHHETKEQMPGSCALELYGVFSKGLKGCKWHFYKGVPWRAKVVENKTGSVERIIFQAPFFRFFLFVRIALLPLLWRMAVQKGGFYFLGTVYRKEDMVTLLFANPGAGKTRMTLQMAVHENIEIIGDGSFIYLPEQGFITVLREIELRYKTINELPFYAKLQFFAKFRLLLCQLISLLTGKFISFNVTLPPEKLGLTFGEDNIHFRHQVRFVRSFQESEALDENKIRENIMLYLQSYIRNYANIFSAEWPLKQSEKNIAAFAKGYASDQSR